MIVRLAVAYHAWRTAWEQPTPHKKTPPFVSDNMTGHSEHFAFYQGFVLLAQITVCPRSRSRFAPNFFVQFREWFLRRSDLLGLLGIYR